MVKIHYKITDFLAKVSKNTGVRPNFSEKAVKKVPKTMDLYKLPFQRC